MLRHDSWLACLTITVLFGCATNTPPPPQVELRHAGIRPASEAFARITTADEFTAAVATDAANTAGLSQAARNLRKREILAVEATSAATAQARALAMASLLQEKDKEKENEKKLDAILGTGFGIGATVTFNVNDDRVESAEILGDDKLVRVTKDRNVVPRMLMEAHYLFTTNPFAREASLGNDHFKPAEAQRERCKANESDCPSVAAGPFIGFQQTADGSSFDGLAVGIALGFRPTIKAGVAIGVGVMFDSSAKVLGQGIEPGKALPKGETVVRFRETGQVNPILSVSFTF